MQEQCPGFADQGVRVSPGDKGPEPPAVTGWLLCNFSPMQKYSKVESTVKAQ